MTNEGRTTAGGAVRIKMDAIDVIEGNPRKTMDPTALTNLADSMARVGLLQPVIVREVDGRFQLVAGHRRHAAAKTLGWTAIDCVVRQVSDEDLLEVRLMENLQRSDIDPLEEAEALATLHARGHAVEALAERLGKSPAYVYQHMRLARLSPAAKKALDVGRLPLSHALLLAGVPDQETQRAALDGWSTGWGENSGFVSLARAREWLAKHAQRDLAKAPFPIDDADLVKGAGTCAACPKRSGTVPGLFDAAENTCMDDTCWWKKVRAHGQRKIDELAAGGATIVPATSVFSKPYERGGEHHVKHDGKYVLADGDAGYDLGHKKWSTLLKGEDRPPAAYAQHPDTGEVVEVWARTDVEKGLKAAGVRGRASGDKRTATSTPQQRAAEARKRLADKIEARTRALTMAAVVEKLDTATAKDWDALWRVIAKAAIDRAWADVVKAVAARRGVDYKGRQPGPALLAAAKTAADARGLAVEVLVSHSAFAVAKNVDAAAKALRVDTRPLRAAARNALEPKRKAKAKAARKAPAKKRARKP